jgi:hypothetical protein
VMSAGSQNLLMIMVVNDRSFMEGATMLSF